MFALLPLGVDAQWVWRDAFWFETHMSGIGSLVAVADTFLFLGDVLARQYASPGARADRLPRLMNAGAALCAALLVIYCFDLFGTALLTAIITLLGPLPLILSLPRFLSKVAKGDAIGRYLLLAFAFYVTTVVVTTATICGNTNARRAHHRFRAGADGGPRHSDRAAVGGWRDVSRETERLGSIATGLSHQFFVI